ncbi:hypothetical protein [Nocardioides stalactiti]|uniref:hypothetical protein n=1 Tax=Nocardioides stalactiti TaxID=2755356 RepID=UPI0015FEC4D9|nr:hypothetical protein [Nocardioides stalactiti]
MASAKSDPGDSPFAYILCGLVLQAFGGAVFGAAWSEDETLIALVGAGIASIGGLLALVGVIGAGVALGLRMHARQSD